jgi:radical SAM superfamily enzyme YgiQ (UPF0313 family)
MNILLTHGYFLFEDPKEQRIMMPYPPLGILYLSAYLEQHQVEHEVFDTTFSDKNTFKTYLLDQAPDVIALYTNLMTKLNILELVKYVKSEASLKNCKIVLGGPDITYNVEAYLQAGADFLVIGEGEETFLELVNALKSTPSWDTLQNIAGLAYLDAHKKVVKTPSRMRLKEIDALPWPNRKKIDLHRYLDTWKKQHGTSSLSVSTQRGCPYTCKWCSTAVYGQSYRRRKAEHVVDELASLQNTYQPDNIWFVDDVFTVSHKWLAAFAAEMQKRKLNLNYECITRADRMNEEVIQLLKASGCKRVWIGAESGSQKIIDAMDRRVAVGQVQEMIRMCNSYGIETGTFIMLGYPGETQEDIQQTVNHLKRANPDLFTITVAYPIKGTGLYEEVENIQLQLPDWESSTDRDRDFERTYSKKYYHYAVRYVVNEVNYYKLSLKRKAISLHGVGYLFKSKLAKTAMTWERLRMTRG